ncbi:protein translocase subunit SecD [Thiospirochaeta perfilievii]|uniref:Protein translocase subunit SecD n=1 Tax=Thiospirochaeta perfilievii TaxID=252967 RepID=A0A5C1QBK1_9SPIO|nr:protein translocase subunit SecD [Thiospirochaeta perfilievii]QEN04249.1 protein translocase subunit SecD [Thiospirochaeta perfilievii]
MNKRFKLLLILALVVLGLLTLKPTYTWYRSLSEEDRAFANESKEGIREKSQVKATEGANAVIELVKANPNGDVPAEYSFLVEAAKEKYKEAGVKEPESWTLSVVLNAFKDSADSVNSLVNLRSAFETYYSGIVFDNKDLKNKILKAGLDLAGGMSVVIQVDKSSIKIEKEDGTFKTENELTDLEISDAVNRSLEILNNRIDEFGLTEPNIRKQGEDQILIEIPGDYDPAAVDTFLKGKGRLNFHIVNNEKTAELKAFWNKNGHINAPEIIGDDYIALGRYAEDRYGIDQFQDYVVLEKEPGLSGTHIKSAGVYRDSMTGGTKVNFELDSEGGDIFFDFTTAHIKEPMAVVMDDKVKSVATINDSIRSQVVVTGFNTEEANNLALILRTAALPVELEVINMQQVGAQLGQDTITKGLYSILYGFLAVMIFMFIYYKGAGLIANIALLLNLFFVIAVLATFNMTLTMTSIAGLILNVGMAVDANVIIFERIKEEIAKGKSRAQSIKTGFGRAFWTIMDANITTLIAALFLSQVGKGPIKGFAVTLAIGIVSSLFTALFVSRFLFDVGTHGLGKKKISIGWGTK